MVQPNQNVGASRYIFFLNLNKKINTRFQNANYTVLIPKWSIYFYFTIPHKDIDSKTILINEKLSEDTT